MESLKSDTVWSLVLAIKVASEKEGRTGSAARQGLEEAFRALSKRGNTHKSSDADVAMMETVIGKGRTEGEYQAASETMKALVKLATYNPEVLEEILNSIAQSCESAGAPAQEAVAWIEVVKSVLVEGSGKWRKEASAGTISYPKLASTEWHIDVGKEPKVSFELKTDQADQQETIRFDASRGMVTVLTDSLKRIKNELQSVSNA